MAGDNSDGLSLRDYFAGQALIACILKRANEAVYGPGDMDVVTVAAYQYADEMLVSRETDG